MLRDRFRVIVQTEWDGAPADALIALHARRSHESVVRYREKSTGGIAVVLTGTDLYRDLPESREAAHSLDLADRIVTLQEEAQRGLPALWRRKSTVIFQSAVSLRARPKRRDRLVCVAVGHLRAEKDPLTLMRAMALVPPDLAIEVRHIGAPLDSKLAAAARALAKRDPRYRYVGALPHGLTRAAVGAAHLLIHPSAMEGGANVIAEAVTSRTAVLASRVPGNVGMLGRRYPGYFPVGDESALARRLVQAFEDPRYLARLEQAGAARRPLFNPAAEARALRKLAAELVA
jgi:putative glycosyltransferase (TIGR04348 family)